MPRRKCLLVGGSGFIGRHLAEELASKGWHVLVTYYRRKPQPVGRHIHLRRCDARNRGQLEKLLGREKPQAVCFLSAQSSVREAWFDPLETLRLNFLGGVYLLEAVRQKHPKTDVFIFSSGTAYGLTHLENRKVAENDCLKPKDPYSLSKSSLDQFARLYAKVHGLKVSVLRLANVVGPGQSTTFSLANFARQIAAMESGKSPLAMTVGNLRAIRDYLDVRDAVRAFRMIIRHGGDGEAYNIGSGQSRRLKDVLGQMFRLSRLGRKRVRIERKAAIMSKDEIPAIRLDTTKFKRKTGWKPVVPFSQTLKDILEDARRKS